MNYKEKYDIINKKDSRKGSLNMYYRHDLDYTYPERSDQHMLELKRTKKFDLDASYDYMPHGTWFKIKRALVASLLHLVVFPLTHLTHGLRIHGRENLKKHKDELKGGAITISNHVFMWDYLCVLKAIRPHISYFPAWKPNFESGFQPFMRILGGIPIPEGDIHAMAAFKREGAKHLAHLARDRFFLLAANVFDELLGDGGAAEAPLSAKDAVHHSTSRAQNIHPCVAVKAMILNGNKSVL